MCAHVCRECMRSKVTLWEPVFSSTTWVLEINEVITFGSQYWLSHLANSGPELLILLKAGIISMNHTIQDFQVCWAST